MQNLSDVINAKLCLGCGLCSFNQNEEDPIEMHYSEIGRASCRERV